MSIHRLSLSLIAIAVSAPLAAGQTVQLVEAPLKDACFRNELTMRLKGTVTIPQNGKPVAISRIADATHVFAERILDGKVGQAERSARHYERADAVIADGEEKTRLALPQTHALLIAHRVKDQLVVYHLTEALTREQLEIASHFDTLAVPGLLPGRAVKVGETWPVPREVVQAICDLDAIEKSDVTGKLEAIEGGVANLSFRGLVSGIDNSAPVTIMVKDATAAFNIKAGRVVGIDWRMSDERQQGPVSPTLSADIGFSLKRTPVQTPAQLSDIALVKVPAGPPPANLTNLSYANATKGFALQFSREWTVVSESADGKLVLRLLDSRGDFLAQCSVTPWRKVAADNQMSLADFAKLMRESAGWQQKEGPPLDETDKIPSPHGSSIYRVTAQGKLSDVDVLRSFYLVAAPTGQQALIDFTMLPAQASKLDGRDVTLVQSLRFTPMSQVEATPTSQKKE